MIVVPCHDCTERVVGCHGRCGRYAAYQVENEKRLEAIKAANEKRDMLRERKSASREKRLRKTIGERTRS